MKFVNHPPAALVVALFLCMGACDHSAPASSAISRADLPTDLVPPTLSGGANDVVDQLCAWTRAQQVGFPADHSRAIYVRTARGTSQSDYSKLSLIEGFLDSGWSGPLSMDVGPDDLFGVASPSLEPLRPIVTHRARWSLSVLPDSQCSANPPEGEHTTLVRHRCLAVEETAALPPDALTADFRIISFVATAGSAPQRASLTVLSLYEHDRLAGRSLSARAYAGPLSGGQVARACEPALLPERFQSIGAGD